MALSVGSLVAFLKGDTRSFEKSLKTAERKVRDFSKNFEEIGIASAGVTLALGAVGAAALKVASDFKEVQSAAEVAFGSQGAAREIEEWADGAAESMGRSRVQMMRFATQAQLLLDPMVGNKEAAARMSKQVTQLAVDIASMNNVTDDEALIALRSALSGEAEPMKRFGVVMTETNLKAYALSKGLSGNVKDMTESGKTALRMAFILERTANAHGDAARTADSFANQLKRAKGQVEDLANRIGGALEPAANALLHSLNRLLGWFKQLDDSTIQWAVGIGTVVAGMAALTAGAVGFLAVLPSIIAGTKALGLTWAGVGTAIKAALLPFLKFALIAIGVIALAGALKMAWDENLFGIREGVAKLGEVFAKVWEWVADGFWNLVSGVMEGVADVIDSINSIRGKIGAIPINTRKMRERAEGLAKGGADRAVALAPFQQAVGEAGDAIADGTKAAVGAIGDQFTSFANVLKKGMALLNPFEAAESKAAAANPIKQVGKDGIPDLLRLAKAGDTAGNKTKTGKVMRFEEELEVKGVIPMAVRVSEALRNAGSRIGESLLSASGGFGKVVESAMKAFATGGLVGAAIAAVGELLAQSKQFQAIAKGLTIITQMVADTLGKMLEPFLGILAAVQTIVGGALKMLAPVFDLLGMLLDPLVAPLMVVGKVLEALAPVLSLVVRMFYMISQPLLLLAGPVMHALFFVLKLAGLGILAAVTPLARFWNWIVSQIQDFLRSLAAIEIAGAKPFDFLNKWADNLEGIKAPVVELQQAFNDLMALSYEDAKAEADKIVATYEGIEATQDAAKAARNVADSLLNVPTGFRVALKRFHAMAAEWSTKGGGVVGGISDSLAGMGPFIGKIPKLASGGIVTRATYAEIGEGVDPEAVIPLNRDKLRELGIGGLNGKIEIHIHEARDARQTAREVLRELKRVAFGQTGSPVGSW